jgi:hypothetical protein
MPIPAFPLLIRALLVWAIIMVAESANGVLRRLLLDPTTLHALRQVSVLVGVLIIFAVAWVFRRWIVTDSGPRLVGIGVLWAILTLVFEFSLGRALGMTWPAMLADYDLTRGGVMALGVLAIALTPWFVNWLDRKRPDRLDERS